MRSEPRSRSPRRAAEGHLERDRARPHCVRRSRRLVREQAGRRHVGRAELPQRGRGPPAHTVDERGRALATAASECGRRALEAFVERRRRTSADPRRSPRAGAAGAASRVVASAARRRNQSSSEIPGAARGRDGRAWNASRAATVEETRIMTPGRGRPCAVPPSGSWTRCPAPGRRVWEARGASGHGSPSRAQRRWGRGTGRPPSAGRRGTRQGRFPSAGASRWTAAATRCAAPRWAGRGGRGGRGRRRRGGRRRA